MNTRRLLLVAAALAAFSARAADERVSIDQVPAPVKKTIEASRDRGTVKEIVRRVVDGRIIYVVELERNNAPNPHLRIAEDGTFVPQPATAYVSTGDIPIVAPEYADAALLAAPRLQLSELPAPAQQTVRAQANGREIVDIDRETWNGRPVYEVEFKERGLNARIYVADDGMLVRDERPRRSVKSFFMGTQLEDTPAAVQQAIRRIAGDREIVDIDKNGAAERATYSVEIKDAQGTQRLRLARDGTILHDTRAPGKPTRD